MVVSYLNNPSLHGCSCICGANTMIVVVIEQIQLMLLFLVNTIIVLKLFLVTFQSRWFSLMQAFACISHHLRAYSLDLRGHVTALTTIASRRQGSHMSSEV